jgi:Tol biopolymer transport system component
VVAFDSQSGRGQIWFVDYPEGTLSRFTNDLSDYDWCCLDITRDGKSLVALQKSVSSDVWIANADGTSAKPITSGEPLGQLGLSWLGDKFMTANAQGNWFLLRSDGNGITALPGQRGLAYSVIPCGNYLVYNSMTEGGFEVWRSDLDGGNSTKLTTGAINGPVCSPDSKSIFYRADGAFWTLPLSGGNPVKSNVPLGMGYSPDGKLYFYIQQRHESGVGLKNTFVVSSVTNRGSDKPLYTFDSPYGMQAPRFTPDGKAIAFMLTHNHATNIWKQPLTGGPMVQITQFTSGDMFVFAWSKDGKQLAFSRGRRKTDVVMMSNFH